MTTPPPLRAQVEAFDWNQTAFGPRAAWPSGLRTVVDLALDSAPPTLVLWGDDLAMLYNDPSAALLGSRHPAALGQPLRTVWPEIWEALGPLLVSVRRGETVRFEDVRVQLSRHGFEEEAYFSFSYTPLRGESGAVTGLFVWATETTAQVLSTRRLAALNDLGERLTQAATAQEVRRFVPPPHPLPDLPLIELHLGGPGLPEALAGVARSRHEQQLNWPLDGTPRPALALPVSGAQQPDAGGVLLTVLNPHLPLDEAYRSFLRGLARQLSSALTRIHWLEQQALNRQLDEERAALSAFVQFTEVVGAETEVRTVMQQAITLLRDLLGAEASYFEREGGLYTIQLWPPDFPPELLARSQAGYTLDFPDIAQAARERRAVFVDDYNDPLRGVAESGLYGAVAFQPFFHNDAMSAVLVMASRNTTRWSERERGVFVAVGRSLTLAFERAQVVAQLSAERRRLQAANEELEAFTYSVSHDLRTPVRHIQGFSKLLRHTLDGDLDPKAAYYLDVLDAGATRMNTLIDAMLALARTSRQPLHPSPLDLAALVDGLRAELEPEQQGRQVAWRIGPLPPLVADRDTLHQALLNLLQNALKYTRTRELAEIAVWGEERPGEWAVFVRDNGVGFDPRYAGKLFGVFQRLHRQEEFEGTGVGLANVRRIVERHGGAVFAEGEVGQGATFGFTVPRP